MILLHNDAQENGGSASWPVNRPSFCVNAAGLSDILQPLQKHWNIESLAICLNRRTWRCWRRHIHCKQDWYMAWGLFAETQMVHCKKERTNTITERSDHTDQVEFSMVSKCIFDRMRKEQTMRRYAIKRTARSKSKVDDRLHKVRRSLCGNCIVPLWSLHQIRHGKSKYICASPLIILINTICPINMTCSIENLLMLKWLFCNRAK